MAIGGQPSAIGRAVGCQWRLEEEESERDRVVCRLNRGLTRILQISRISASLVYSRTLVIRIHYKHLHVPTFDIDKKSKSYKIRAYFSTTFNFSNAATN